MIDPQPLFTNFFADKDHSFKELSRYANKHLIYLTANNPGNVLDAVITEVSGAFADFAACLGDEEALAAAREAANQARDNVRKGMSGPTGAVSRAANAVAGAFGKPSPDYTACFPLGIEGITKATNDQMEERLENLRAALVARQANVALPPHVTTITALKTQWVSLKTAAGTALGAESTQEDHRDACRVAITRALSRSALWLAWHFNGEPEKFALYCPVHLLKNAQAQPPGTATLTGEGGIGHATLTGEASNADVMKYFKRLPGETEWTPIGEGAPGAPFMAGGLAAQVHEFMCRGANDEGEGADSDVLTIEVT
jgi:hypothetical protein